jgi:phytanoyl-CoA hydroxylase
MNDRLTPQQIADYRDHGFVVIPDFLSADELAVWQKAIRGAIADRGEHKLPGRVLGGKSDYYDNVFIQRINLWQDHPDVKELILDPRIGRMCCDLEGIDGIRVWHDQALCKEAWANPTSWHRDVPYWSFDSTHALSIWIALEDATFENGCLFFVPGTNQLHDFSNVGIGGNMNAIFKVLPQFAQTKPVAAPMKAGACSFHNGLTIHGATCNMTPGTRDAMTCAFMPDGATFNGKKNILTDAQIAKLQIGSPLNEPDQNPLVWHRSWAK